MQTGEEIMKECLLNDIDNIIANTIKECSSYMVGEKVYPSLYEGVLTAVINFCDDERHRIAPYTYIKE